MAKSNIFLKGKIILLIQSSSTLMEGETKSKLIV